MQSLRTTARLCLCAIVLSALPAPALGFNDVRPGLTPYSEAIQFLQEEGVVEGYEDGTYKPTADINRAEFLKIILESRGIEVSGDKCFPDVRDQWFAEYVCAAKQEGIIEGYPDGTFKPEKAINFAEASKILARAYGQSIEEYSPDWYEPFVRALESSKAIPLSIEKLDQQVNRGEMAEMMWRLKEEKTDEPSKGYLNVKYPEVMVNMASDSPQRASSCADLKAFTEEASRGYGNEYYMMDDAVAAPLGMGFGMAPMRAKSGVAQEMAMDTNASDGDYSQTNVQVSGVDEADIVKTDGTYVYAVLEGQIRIAQARPADSMKLLSTLSLQNDAFQPSELYIDGDRLVLLGNTWRTYERPAAGFIPGMIQKMIAPEPFYGGNQTEVRIYNVTDRSKPTLERTVAFDGNIVSTRKIGDKLYLVMNENVRWHVPSPIPVPLEDDLLPKFSDSSESDAEQPVARCGDVVILPRVPQPQYLIVAVIPTNNPEGEVKREVVLGSAENVYSSLQNLYIAATQWNYRWNGPQGTSEEKTSIFRFALTENGIEMKAQGSVPGRVLNQFSMDESEGYFRIATTKGDAWNSVAPSTNNLYVLNMNLEQVGKIEGIAPGETIYSVRFMGKRAYLVTFKKIDPFFAIDLTDPTNPKILGKLKIPGYSDYLHPYDENHIIGFGKEAVESKEGDFAWYQGMKMAVFDVTDPENPIELHKFGIGDRGTESPLLHNHKALLFDKERQLLAFPVEVHKISQEEKSNPESNAWGEPVFQGAYVFNLNLETGFTLKGTISHYNQQDYLMAGSYFYGKNVERILRIEDSLITLSAYGLQSHSVDSVNLEADMPFTAASDTASACPDKDDNGVVYVSDDPSTCTTINFYCQENQTAFSNECGCGCVPSE